MTTQTETERAIQQEWAVKVQELENKLELVRGLCEQYLDGLLTPQEAIDGVCLAIHH